MASKFQSRLVGTIILVAIGIIVLPDVLDGKKPITKKKSRASPLSRNSTASLKALRYLIRLMIVKTYQRRRLKSWSLRSLLLKNKPLPVAIKEVPERNEYQDSAWIVQLMALKNADNAKNLVKDLQKRGYQAHTKPENGFTRVIIGPDVSKSKLERQIIELEKITGSKGQLLKF